MEDLSLAGQPVGLDEMNLYVFRGLRPEYQNLTALLSVRGQPVTLTELADFLGAQEFIRGADSGGSPVAFTIQQGERNRGGNRGGNRDGQGNGSNRGGGRSSGGRNGGQRGRVGQGGNDGQTQCQICGCTGHSALACYNRYDPPPQANLTYQNNSPDQNGSQVWIPDPGATNHVTPDIAALSTYEEYTCNDILRVGDGKALSISRVGHASFNTPSRSVQLSNILHVRSLSTSLLSVQKFALDNKVFFEFHPFFFCCE
ncbi:PREDICTED: probable H/ACA ribonucleoprotein complex subunit 1-like protein [Ipomoea nil]|uniref:probable H/ACA ribonucleoprotein complex subunit 1-like protein n=1 Tax=Ipomoea nil TaxID=35883 RepID=UPI0009015A86|nr:PREDICTED: probable H/ACA ribonucleoprotein complex subunit 1-like protein [Ipomoea nil]